MSYQPICMFLSERKKQLISEVGVVCYTFMLNTLKKRVFNDRLTPARDDKILDIAPRQLRGTYYTLDFAIPFPQSSRYDSAHLRIVKTTVEYVEYVIVWDYTLRKRKSQK